jgi:hypothetical protein
LNYNEIFIQPVEYSKITSDNTLLKLMKKSLSLLLYEYNTYSTLLGAKKYKIVWKKYSKLSVLSSVNTRICTSRFRNKIEKIKRQSQIIIITIIIITKSIIIIIIIIITKLIIISTPNKRRNITQKFSIEKTRSMEKESERDKERLTDR